MSGYNMPPGVYESDIPGWNDITHTWTNDCSHCDGPNEIEADVDSRYGGEVEWTCEHCGKEFTASINFERDDWDDRED